MPLLQRRIDEQPVQPGGNEAPGTPERLQEVRSEADRLLSVGDEAIRRALSAGNSEAFLRSVRQQGGQ
jgi:hypothetical protein